MNSPATTALHPGAVPAPAGPTAATSSIKPLALGTLGALSASHLINDMMQSLILALYPVLKGTFSLS
ncbi:MAG: MFS transporter, partial [Caldimonas sp.]